MDMDTGLGPGVWGCGCGCGFRGIGVNVACPLATVGKPSPAGFPSPTVAFGFVVGVVLFTPSLAPAVAGDVGPLSRSFPKFSNLDRKDDMGLIEEVSGPSPSPSMLVEFVCSRAFSRQGRGLRFPRTYSLLFVRTFFHMISQQQCSLQEGICLSSEGSRVTAKVGPHASSRPSQAMLRSAQSLAVAVAVDGQMCSGVV